MVGPTGEETVLIMIVPCPRDIFSCGAKKLSENDVPKLEKHRNLWNESEHVEEKTAHPIGQAFQSPHGGFSGNPIYNLGGLNRCC